MLRRDGYCLLFHQLIESIARGERRAVQRRRFSGPARIDKHDVAVTPHAAQRARERRERV
jgi:hypothetical protein